MMKCIQDYICNPRELMNAQNDFVTANSVSIGNIFLYLVLPISTKKYMKMAYVQAVDTRLSFKVLFLNKINSNTSDVYSTDAP